MAGGIVGVLGAGAVTYATASAPDRPQEHGREPAVRTVQLADQGAGRRSLPRQGTERFSAALLTWDDPHAELKGTAEIRARSARTGQWSHWQTLPNSRFEGRTAGVRGGTSSVWTGDADGVEVRVVRGDGTAAPGQPTGLSVILLDPGTDRGSGFTAARRASADDGDGTPGRDGAAGAAVIQDTGADSDNALSCAESRARMRTLRQEYLARGSSGLGRHFVVDRCGQVFEGRGGGSDNDTVGISWIGDHTTARPSRAALEATARILAGTSGRYGVDPGAIALPRHLSAQLPRIAALVKAPGVSHAPRTSDYDGDGVADLVAGTPKANSVTVIPGGVDGPAVASRLTITQDSPGVPGSTRPGDDFGAAAAWGDVNGDGHADLAIGAPGKDDAAGNADRGSVTVLYGPALNTGFSYTTSGVAAAGARLGSAVAVGDFDADGHADVFSAGTGGGGTWNVRPAGGATTSGRLTAATGPVADLDAATGDFNGDGYADVVLNYRDGDGIGWVARFTGSAAGLTGAGLEPVRGGRSVAAGDINGDGYDDLVVGRPRPSESGGTPGGHIAVLLGSAEGLTTTGMKTIHQDAVGVAGADRSGDAFGFSVAVGDFDADGHADVLVGAPGEDFTRDGVDRADAGQATLLRGTPSGPTVSGSFTLCQDTPGILDATEKGDRFGSSVSLTDLSGHGRAGLVIGSEGEDAGDGLLLYTPVHSTGFGLARTVALRGTTLGTPAGARLGRILAP
ncbi:FG-GAP-like repeat-containing protein [Streptomyces triticisoli]|uniref:FG-GAP-like repeat-containing protein n=1 Tax=Streptomyces triticisoli TaxID=2182797 RepID=UPI001E306DD6|nr:FG-GAP-like repeat-containing protein [Streptomyces triticisoli]